MVRMGLLRCLFLSFTCAPTGPTQECANYAPLTRHNHELGLVALAWLRQALEVKGMLCGAKYRITQLELPVAQSRWYWRLVKG
jgi:hypothetical protein